MGTKQYDARVVEADRRSAFLGQLESLGNHFFTLAQSTVPAGEHLHLDDSNALEDGSCALIVERR
jgi:hypothetical protein